MSNESVYNDDSNNYSKNNESDTEMPFSIEVSELSSQSQALEEETTQISSQSKKLRSSGLQRQQHKCPMCIMTFVSLKVLRRHLANRHPSSNKEAVDDVGDEENVTHINNVINPISRDEVELTVENVPKPRLLPRSPTTPNVDGNICTTFNYYCDFCNAGFAQRKTLTYHMKQNCMTSTFKVSIINTTLQYRFSISSFFWNVFVYKYIESLYSKRSIFNFAKMRFLC